LPSWPVLEACLEAGGPCPGLPPSLAPPRDSPVPGRPPPRTKARGVRCRSSPPAEEPGRGVTWMRAGGERTVAEGDRHGGGPAGHRGALVGGPGLRAPRGLPRPGDRPGSLALRACRGRPRGVLGRAGRAADLVLALGSGHDVDPAVGDVVRGGNAERLLQLPGPPRRGRRGRQGRLPLGGRARRGAHDHLQGAARRGLPIRERPEVARCREGRSRGDLPRHGARAPRRDARLRPDRRAPLGRLRRLLRGVPPRSDQRRRGEDRDHRRRWVPTRRRRPAEGQHRRRGRRVPLDRARRHGAPDRRRPPVHARGGTSGTTSSSTGSRPSASRSRSERRTRCTSSTRAGRPASRRASSTPPAATSHRWRRRTG
jgi:hypothetical protein